MTRKSSVHLGVLDLLPAGAIPALAEAFDALLARRSQQIDIVAELNGRLAELAINPVSNSTFNRWALRVRAGEVTRPGALPQAAPSTMRPFKLSSASRAFLAAALRSLADDLDGDPR